MRVDWKPFAFKGNFPDIRDSHFCPKIFHYLSTLKQLYYTMTTNIQIKKWIILWFIYNQKTKSA